MSGEKKLLIVSSVLIFVVASVAFSLPNTVSIRTTNYPRLFFGWDAGDGVLLEPVDSETSERTTFRIVSGLSDPTCVSFQCATNGDYYLRQQNNAIRFQRIDPGELFRSDATFRKVPGLVGDNETFVSFEAVTLPRYFIRHRNMKLVLDPYEDSDLYGNDATFVIIPPNWNGKDPKTRPGRQNRVPIDAGQLVNLLLFIVLAATAVVLCVCAIVKKEPSPAGPDSAAGA
jgi:hypothetical protein